MTAATLASSVHAAEAPSPPAGRRGRWRLVAGALVVVATAVGFTVYGAAAAETTPVLVVSQPVAMGQPLRAGDVATAQVRLAPGVQAVPGSRAQEVLGRPAAVPLLPGQLLAPGNLGPAAVPAGGEVTVAVAVPLPPAGLAAGSRVRVLVTAEGGAAAPAEQVEGETAAGLLTPVTSARVVEVGVADATGARVVSLLLPASEGEQVAVAAAAGRVSLVTEAAG